MFAGDFSTLDRRNSRKVNRGLSLWPFCDVTTVALLNYSVSGSSAKDVRARSEDSPSMGYCSLTVISTGFTKHGLKMVMKRGQVISSHHKMLVVEVQPDLYLAMPMFFGLVETVEDTNDSSPMLRSHL